MATFVYRATFIFQEGLRCCHMALISLRFFRKNLGNLRDFFGQMVYRPPWQKISRTPMRIPELCTGVIKGTNTILSSLNCVYKHVLKKTWTDDIGLK